MKFELLCRIKRYEKWFETYAVLELVFLEGLLDVCLGLGECFFL